MLGHKSALITLDINADLSHRDAECVADAKGWCLKAFDYPANVVGMQPRVQAPLL